MLLTNRAQGSRRYKNAYFHHCHHAPPDHAPRHTYCPVRNPSNIEKESLVKGTVCSCCGNDNQPWSSPSACKGVNIIFPRPGHVEATDLQLHGLLSTVCYISTIKHILSSKNIYTYSTVSEFNCRPGYRPGTSKTA